MHSHAGAVGTRKRFSRRRSVVVCIPTLERWERGKKLEHQVKLYLIFKQNEKICNE